MNLERIKNVYNAFDPRKPATEAQYKDCSEGRGGGVFAREFIAHLDRSETFLCTLFTGHIGTGKSSELAELARVLEKPTPAGKHFFPIIIDTNHYLDEFDADVADLFLAIVTETANRLKEALDIKLESGYFQKRLSQLKNVLLSDLSSDGGEFSLFGLKTRVQALKQDRRNREIVRAAIADQQTTFLQAVNAFLDDANQQLRDYKQQAYAGLVLIVDNLEKVQVVGNHKEGIVSQQELFIERAPTMTALRAHIIYTVPLRLARQSGPELGQRYDQEPFVLPMIKIIEKRNRAPYSKGIECLRRILTRRLENLALDEVITEDALEFLITYSGGNLRQLMNFAQNASARVKTLPINKKAAEGAIAQTVRAYSTSIPQVHWSKLASLDLSEDCHIDNRDADYLAMLESQSILEYLNGFGEDVFEGNEPWYVVHPVVRQLRGFKEARDRLEKEQA